jgi:hypothetical protein
VTPSASLTAVAAGALLHGDTLLRLCRNTGGFTPLLGGAPLPGPGPPRGGGGRAAAAPAQPLQQPMPRPAPAPTCTPADATRRALGERGFYLARATILRQQETFRAQVFELHRLARTQAALEAEHAAPHAAATAAYAAEAEALLAARATAAGTPSARKRPREAPEDEGAGPLPALAKRREPPPGGQRPVEEDDRGAHAVGSLPLHVSLMLNIPSRLRKGILAGAPAGASAPAAVAADLFWAPRKTAGVRRPVASRYPSGGGACLPTASGATTVAQPCRSGGRAAATHRGAAPAASAPGALAAPGCVLRPAAAPAAAPLAIGRQRSVTSAGCAGPTASGATAGTSSGVIRPKALPAAARPPVPLPSPVEGPRPRIGTPSRSVASGGGGRGNGGASSRPPSCRAGTPRSIGAPAASAPLLPPCRPLLFAAAPTASVPPLAPSAGAAPRPFASLQLPALSGQLMGNSGGAALSAPSINPFRPTPQLQPLLASQLMAGGAANGPSGLLLPQPFDPHAYWMQKHFGAGGVSGAPSASLGATPALKAGVRATASPQQRAAPATSLDSSRLRLAAVLPGALASPLSASTPAAAAASATSAGAAAAAAAAAAAPARPPAVVHWWQDPKAVFGDGPGLLDPNTMGDEPPGLQAPPPPLTRAAPRLRSKHGSPGRRAHSGGGAGSPESDSSCREASAAAGPHHSMPPPAAVAAAGGAAAGAVRGSAFRAVERRAPAKPRGSRQWSSRPSRLESVDSDGRDASHGRAAKRHRGHGHGHGHGGGGGPECSQRTDGSANASAAAGILLSLSSGG